MNIQQDNYKKKKKKFNQILSTERKKNLKQAI